MRKSSSELDFFKDNAKRFGFERALLEMTKGTQPLVVLYSLIAAGWFSYRLDVQWLVGMTVCGWLWWIFGPDKDRYLKRVYDDHLQAKKSWLNTGIVVMCLIRGWLTWSFFTLIKMGVVWVFWND